MKIPKSPPMPIPDRIKAAFLVAILSSLSSQAQITQLGSPADLAGLGVPGVPKNYDWSDVGLEYTLPANPFNLSGATVSNPDGTADFEVLVQSSGWFGNFNPGDYVMRTDSGAIVLEFAQPIFGGGAYIQADVLSTTAGSTGDFFGFVEALDAHGHSLFVASLQGLSTDLADGSSIFVGLGGPTAEIRSLVFSVSNLPNDPNAALDSFAIGEVFTIGSVVPEASSGTASVFLGGIVLAGLRSRQQATKRASQAATKTQV